MTLCVTSVRPSQKLRIGVADNLRDLSSFESLLEQSGAAKPLEVMFFLLEDTAKLIGILLWLGYAVQKSAQFMRARSNQPVGAESSSADD